ncbi:energy transducer TonB [Haliscomenobacter hydrossis]|uniref:TonB family protein n=1 Tax=Haliscomenobacter hydrossis (strain ATCC 27775 / DSM 1100 / LMG 10767 / O) TaxID=760192 RepID=F4KU87_HALH1|nr:energy transducer TonB [Haliscomenobacter hydrossis]AEE50184.1 TonB family protein [Haliscomenobacter hydrossis DSM 1100]
MIQCFPRSKQVAERYSVLKSDRTVKHGSYVAFFKMSEKDYERFQMGVLKLEDFVKIKGNYQLGKKGGEWEEYIQPQVLKTKGNYLGDKKIGVWFTAREEAQVIERYDFDLQKKLRPIFQIKVVYPENARKAGHMGTISLSFQTSSDCTVSNITLLQSASPALDNAAMIWMKKYAVYLKNYGVECTEKIDTQIVVFNLEE